MAGSSAHDCHTTSRCVAEVSQLNDLKKKTCRTAGTEHHTQTHGCRAKHKQKHAHTHTQREVYVVIIWTINRSACMCTQIVRTHTHAGTCPRWTANG